jgi:hypothetical protein
VKVEARQANEARPPASHRSPLPTRVLGVARLTNLQIPIPNPLPRGIARGSRLRHERPRNDRAEYSEAKSLINGFEAVLLERPVECDQGGKFRVHVRCQGDLTKAGPFRLVLPFIDKMGNSGWSEAIFDHFLGRVTVKNHMGQPE